MSATARERVPEDRFGSATARQRSPDDRAKFATVCRQLREFPGPIVTACEHARELQGPIATACRQPREFQGPIASARQDARENRGLIAAAREGARENRVAITTARAAGARLQLLRRRDFTAGERSESHPKKWVAPADDQKFETLVAGKGGEDVAILEMTWADKLEAKGEARGEAKGMRGLLLEQMEERFGPLPAAVRRHVEAVTSTDELRRLARKVLTAASPEEMGLG